MHPAKPQGMSWNVLISNGLKEPKGCLIGRLTACKTSSPVALVWVHRMQFWAPSLELYLPHQHSSTCHSSSSSGPSSRPSEAHTLSWCLSIAVLANRPDKCTSWCSNYMAALERAHHHHYTSIYSLTAHTHTLLHTLLNTLHWLGGAERGQGQGNAFLMQRKCGKWLARLRECFFSSMLLVNQNSRRPHGKLWIPRYSRHRPQAQIQLNTN